MLFPYKFLPHRMDTMQAYVQFIFEEVWCKAEEGADYDIDALFAAKPDLQDMITELDNLERKGADNFLTSLQTLFENFMVLDKTQKQQLKDWFEINNDIQKLCEQGDQCQPATYLVIEDSFPKDKFPDLVKELKKFYQNLYSADFLTLKSVKSRIGDIADHNNEFTKINDLDICPFCGLSGMLNHYHSKREAYDHYFPKDKYPFNSINFYNLVPACPRCNSSYKLAKDPHLDLKDPLKTPRKVFYPFADQPYPIELGVKINNPDWENITPDDINVDLYPESLQSELNTWDDLYGIIERYKAECCSKSAGKEWLTDIFDLAKSKGKSPSEYLEGLEASYKRSPYVEKRFLKKAFLEGCQTAGLFDKLPCSDNK